MGKMHSFGIPFHKNEPNRRTQDFDSQNIWKELRILQASQGFIYKNMLRAFLRLPWTFIKTFKYKINEGVLDFIIVLIILIRKLV